LAALPSITSAFLRGLKNSGAVPLGFLAVTREKQGKIR